MIGLRATRRVTRGLFSAWRIGNTSTLAIIAQLCKNAQMNAAETQKTADFLKALGEFNRLSLVYELCRCESSQNAMCLCDCCSVDASVVSRHLKVLAERDIVTFDKVGREKTYRLNRNKVATQLRELADLIENEDCNRGYHDV